MSEYKMIVLDLDGTLTNRNKEITPKTKETLMKAQEQGKIVVLASGRPTYGVIWRITVDISCPSMVESL